MASSAPCKLDEQVSGAERERRVASDEGMTMTLRTGTAIVSGSPEAAPPPRDPLPEYLEWRDDGCEVAPHCLTCPLPRCRYDDPGGLRGLLNETRDAEVVRARALGRPVDEIAARFGISRRSVFRILRRRRQTTSGERPASRHRPAQVMLAEGRDGRSGRQPIEPMEVR